MSRSIAAAALVLMQANPEWPASAAFGAVVAIRPRAWPNLLILEIGDALLNRNGEIAAAAAAIYRRVLARDSEFGDHMVAAARDREEIGRTGQFDAHETAWQSLTSETDRLISVLRTVCN